MKMYWPVAIAMKDSKPCRLTTYTFTDSKKEAEQMIKRWIWENEVIAWWIFTVGANGKGRICKFHVSTLPIYGYGWEEKNEII